jgi:PAS domain S-box-containing protein
MTGPQGKKGKSIQSRLVMLLLFILIPVLAIQAYIYYDDYQARRAFEFQANLEVARSVARTFESFVQDVIHHELVIGLAITSPQPMASEDITRLLISFTGYAAVRDFTWLNPKGNAVYSGNPAVVGNSYSDRSFFRDIANGREWAVSELVISKASGKPVFGISQGIRDEKGALLGVVVAIIIPENLDARLAVERGKGGGHALVDSKGMLVYRYPAINPTWEERNWLKQYPEYEEVLKGQEIATTVYAPYEKKNRLVSFTPVSSLGWAATAGKPEEDVVRPILISMAKSALLFLSVSFAAFFIALALSRKIASPVTALSAHALALGHGQRPMQVNPDDILEFQNLSAAFNAMAEKVQTRETALRDSEQRWAVTLASIGDAVIATDTGGRVTFLNRVAEVLTGWSMAEAMGKPLKEIFHIVNEHTRAAVEDPVSKVVQTGLIVGLANHTVLLRRGGGKIPIDDSGAPIRNEDGHILGVVLVFRDISERKRAEEALRLVSKRMEWLARFPEENPSPIARVSVEGRVLYRNPTIAALPGWACEAGQAIPEPLMLLVGQALSEKLGMQQDIGLGGRYYSVSVAPFPAEGYANVYGIDITERKAAEEALWESEKFLRQANEYLEQRVQERTAELKERAGQLARLASQLTMAEQRERKRLGQILHDGLQQYLLAAKLQVGGLLDQATDDALKQAASEVENLLSESIRVSRSLAAELTPPILHEAGLSAGLGWLSRWMSDKHRLKVELVMPMDALVLTDDAKVLLFESVRELLLNVVKHAGTLSARVSLAQEDGRSLQIVVSDNGVGFDPARLSVEDGCFGLFSIHERLCLIGGGFEVDSSPGKGARFTLIVPLSINEPLESSSCAQPIAVNPNDVHRLPTSSGKIRILLTDDHSSMREGLARLLGQETDFDVVGQANDGQEAVEMAGELIPDVILMDISMPRMNGIDATRMIHQQHPDIRIIGLSLYQEEERAKGMLDSGAVFYLTKSCAPADVKTAIRSSMRERQGSEKNIPEVDA